MGSLENISLEDQLKNDLQVNIELRLSETKLKKKNQQDQSKIKQLEKQIRDIRSENEKEFYGEISKLQDELIQAEEEASEKYNAMYASLKKENNDIKNKMVAKLNLQEEEKDKKYNEMNARLKKENEDIKSKMVAKLNLTRGRKK